MFRRGDVADDITPERREIIRLFDFEISRMNLFYSIGNAPMGDLAFRAAKRYLEKYHQMMAAEAIEVSPYFQALQAEMKIAS